MGIDHEEILPSENDLAKNLKFIKHNILDGIPYENDTFDFIHMNIMMKSFTDAEWETIIVPEIFRVCKPGGWIEVCKSF